MYIGLFLLIPFINLIYNNLKIYVYLPLVILPPSPQVSAELERMPLPRSLRAYILVIARGRVRRCKDLPIAVSSCVFLSCISS